MQNLYPNGSKDPMAVVRGFSSGPNGTFIVERGDGTWGYLNGQNLTNDDDIAFIPEVHRNRIKKWLKSFGKDKDKLSQQTNELSEMPLEKLQIIAGDDKTMDRGKLIERIMAQSV